MIKKIVILAMLLAAVGSTAQAYELGTHGALTYEAYKRSVLADTELLNVLGIENGADPFGTIYYDISGTEIRERTRRPFEEDQTARRMPLGTEPLSIEGWLMRGAIREDDWTDIDILGCRLQAPNPNEDNLNRPRNYFYDPVHDRGLTVGLGIGEKAPDWGLGTTGFLSNPPPTHLGRVNHYTILDAREAQYRALTGKNQDQHAIAPTKEERNKYWATTFRALVGVVHLIQDMGQPQHTHNDQSQSFCQRNLA